MHNQGVWCAILAYTDSLSGTAQVSPSFWLSAEMSFISGWGCENPVRCVNDPVGEVGWAPSLWALAVTTALKGTEDRWSLLLPKLSESTDTIWCGWPTIPHYRAMRGDAGDAVLLALLLFINRFFAGNSPLNMGWTRWKCRCWLCESPPNEG